MLTLGGEPFALSRLIDGKSKDVNAKLGDPNQLRSVDETKAQIGEKIAPRLSSYIAEAKPMAVNALKPIIEQKQKLTTRTSRHEKNLMPRPKTAGTMNSVNVPAARAKAGPAFGII